MERPTGSFNQNAIRKIKKNPLGIISFSLIVLAALVTIFAYGISTDKVKDANQQNVILAHKPMGYTQKILEIPLENYTKTNSIKDFFFGKQVETDQIAINSYEMRKDSILYTPYLG